MICSDDFFGEYGGLPLSLRGFAAAQRTLDGASGGLAEKNTIRLK